MEHYRSYRKYVRSRFGCRVQTIPVSAGFSCPNRDGTKSNSGCSFCDNRSFSPVADEASSVVTQIERAISHAPQKIGAFIVYLQPFSNTYGTLAQLSSIYEPIISYPRVVGLSVGTRPDCFTEEIYDYLSHVSRRTYLCVEVGLQSAHDATLTLHHRGHTVEDFRQCIFSLSTREIATVAHVILGLPYETEQMMMETAQEIADLPVTGIKIHQLMVIRGTLLHQWYEQGKIECLTLERYAETLAGFLSYLRPDQFIHRLAAEASIKNGLIAPLWSRDKQPVLDFLNNYMDKEHVVQGSRWKGYIPPAATRVDEAQQ